MIAILVEMMFLSLFIVLGVWAVRRARLEQKRRLEAYTKSPDSRLLHLND